MFQLALSHYLRFDAISPTIHNEARTNYVILIKFQTLKNYFPEILPPEKCPHK